MSHSILRKICVALAAGLGIASTAVAEDIDLFTSANRSSASTPNVLIIIDNSSNWARNDQGWPLGKQGESELRAIYTLLGDVSVGTNTNLGLMMLSTGAVDGAYIRYHIRNMTATNKSAFREMIGNAACADGANSLNGTPNCILKNFSSGSRNESISAASAVYSAAMFEAFKYFGGYTEPSKALLDLPGSPVDSTHFGVGRYSTLDSRADKAAYTDSAGSAYAQVASGDGSASCAKNYIIFIGNGYPSNDSLASLITGINGSATVPAPIGNKSNRAANWAKYLYSTDVSALLGKQSVATYTIDVFNAKPDAANQTPLLKAMAKFGGGRYFEARSEDAIVKALQEILIDIQSVNSVFASASLPINSSNRSQNENQVFIGMFRPDSNARPRWYGNLKQYQIALFGSDARLADKAGTEAVSASTGFLRACATSFWTTDSGNYWEFMPDVGSCTTSSTNPFSDLPDGSVVERGGAAEVLRRGNNPSAAAPFALNRTMYTCSGTCGAMVPFNATTVPISRTLAADPARHTSLINYTLGQDVDNESGREERTAPRPSIHGDITHSRPLPVNFGGSRKVEVYYGTNDGAFRAVEGATGRELWSFVAPEHHAKLKRLQDNAPQVLYPDLPTGVIPAPVPKDYFFDGAAGLYQGKDNSEVWIFPTMRRGGRMLYAFDVTQAAPRLKWAVGCPNAGNDNGCTAGMEQLGQTWSLANAAFIKGHNSGANPLIVMGGGYDPCLDVNSPVTSCTDTSKGNRAFIIDAADGTIVKSFVTERSVVADVALVDRNFDGMVDHAYVTDVAGSIYRIDFVDTTTNAALAASGWTMSKVAYSNTGNRKFLFTPAALVIGAKVYLALGSGDREAPLISQYPYTTPIANRFYSFTDKFTNVAFDLDGSTMANYTASTSCADTLAIGKDGWYMNLEAGRGEQTVTSAVIFGGTVFFSTNRPTAGKSGSCGSNLGEARGYAVNMVNASGVIGSGKLCGGERSDLFTGGGLPPSPVVGTVPVKQANGTMKATYVLIGGINVEAGVSSSAIAAQEPKVPIRQVRSRIYWYPHGDR